MVGAEPGRRIDRYVESLGDWRGELLGRVRALALHVVPDATEVWTPDGVPTWSVDRTICTAAAHPGGVTLTVAPDGDEPHVVELGAVDDVDAKGLASLLREAAGLPRLLSGENPQVPRGDGPEAVRGYLDAMPGWKRDVGRHLHALVVATLPDVEQAVRWNSPFYGVEGHGWIISFHCITRYVKVTFFAGARLDPPPPETSKDESVRHLHVHEGEEVDDALVTSWIEQAARIDGWIT